MLIVVAGKDREGVYAKIKSVCVEDGHVEAIEIETLDTQILGGLVHAVSLFGDLSTYIIRDCDENEEVEKYIFQNALSLQQSPHIFICSIKSVLKKERDILETSGAILHEIAPVAKKETQPFILADAFLSRDKKRAWKALNDELESKSPEEVHGGLWYQIKCIMLVQSGASQEESGLHPFVYSKIKNAQKLFASQEVALIADTLVRMPHDAHRGTSDFASALELFILRFTK